MKNFFASLINDKKKLALCIGAVAALILLIAVICVCCGFGSSGATEPTGTTGGTVPSGDISYSVTVTDPLGQPCGSGVIVQFLSGGNIAAMQTLDETGTAVKVLPAGEYTVELSFTDGSTGYHYSGVTLTAAAPAATVTLAQGIEGESTSLNVSGQDHNAWGVSAGCTYVELQSGMNYFLFTPTEAGLYEFSVVGGWGEIGYYGSPFFVQTTNLAEPDENGSFTFSVSASMIGTSGTGTTILVLGVQSEQADCFISIRRIGDPEKTIEDYEWTVYQPTVSISPFTLGENIQLIDFNITSSDTYTLVRNEADGFYHLGTTDGPVVYCKLGVGTAYLDSIQTILESSGINCYFYDADGNFSRKETYNDCLQQYVDNMDEETGVYPLTDDLIYIIKTRGEFVGWWDSSSATYIFKDENGNPVIGLNPENAWLFLCCYGQETEPQPTEPQPTDPEPTEPQPTEPEPTDPEPDPTEPVEPDVEFQMGTLAAGTTELFYYQIAETMSFEASVKAGQYARFDLYRMFDMVLEIESDYAYIVYNGEVYLPEDGVLTFELVYTSNDVSSPCTLYIGNFGNKDTAFTVKLSTLPGTQNNPVALPLGTFTTCTPYGADQGYYYTFTAQKSGTLTVTFESIDIKKDCQISLYNLNTYAYVVETNGTLSIQVNAGDTVQINVAVMDAKYEFPAATIVATATFE